MNTPIAWHWQPGHAVRSSPVSGTVLQKTGIMAKMCRDFRHGGPMNYQIRDTETLHLTQEGR